VPNVATIEAVVAAAVVDCSSKTNFLNGKTMEKQWKDNGKTMEKQWKNNGKTIQNRLIIVFDPKKKKQKQKNKQNTTTYLVAASNGTLRTFNNCNWFNCCFEQVVATATPSYE